MINVNNHQDETNGTAVKEVGSIDTLIRSFWEKAHAASELITRLRSEQRSLSDRVAQLEREVTGLRSDVTNRDTELKRVRYERDQLLNSNGHERMTDEEKEHLKERIRELIAKINSHL
jgi:chromosome segregation ATPase